MLLVPPYKQYHNSYAVATAPFEPSIAETVKDRIAYVNYTNIAVGMGPAPIAGNLSNRS